MWEMPHLVIKLEQMSTSRELGCSWIYQLVHTKNTMKEANIESTQLLHISWLAMKLIN